MAMIHEAITAVMREVGAIPKARKNEQQGFMYRGIDDLYDRLQPLMTRHGVFTVPETLSERLDQGTSQKGGAMFHAVLKVRYTFFASDGSSVAAIVASEGMDYGGDKASNKAMTGAHKTALSQVFNIPFNTIDPDAFTPDWAANDSGRISPKQFTALKTAWWQTAKKQLADADESERVAAFREWALSITGADEFAVDNWREWTAEDLAKCRAALEAGAAKALEKSGL